MTSSDNVALAPSHMRTFILFICLMFAAALARSEDSPLVLSPGNIACPGEQHIQNVLRNKTEDAQNQAATLLIKRGICMTFITHMPVAKLRNVSSDGLTYECFDILDSMVKRLNNAEYCAPAGATAKLGITQRERSGAYRILLQSSESVSASCIEGGEVTLLYADRDGWYRISELPFETRRKYKDGVAVKGELQTVLTQGCRGEDYE